MKRKRRSCTIYISFFRSRLGLFGLASSEKGLVFVQLPPAVKSRFKERLAHRFRGASIVERESPNAKTKRQLEQYLRGKRKKFDLAMDLRAPRFQRRVLEEVTAIPYGETASYGEIARRAGNPRAARAVGAVMRSNPLPIIVPCHRVIGHDGSLVGFGGGLELKAALLRSEGVRT